MRLLTRIAQGVVVAVAVAALGFFAIGPRLLDYRTLTMLSGSMGSSFPTGSVIVDTQMQASALRVGDVLTYHIPVLDRHVETHRIVSLRRLASGALAIRTRGDANRAPDAWTAIVRPGRVWVASADIPRLGWLLVTARSRTAWGVLRWLVPGLALIWLLVGLWWDATESESANDPVAGDVRTV